MSENRPPEPAAEWEESKENVLPLKSGRKFADLQAALTDSVDSRLREQQDVFELELRMYTGDDPLDLWHRYISWAEQSYPKGGLDAKLKAMLEKCVGTFTSDARYFNDQRYVDLCIKLANMSPEPNEVFKYLHSHSIGSELTSFYQAWSWNLEAIGDLKMAYTVLDHGISRRARPVEKLRKYLSDFQARAAIAIAASMEDAVLSMSTPFSAPPSVPLAQLHARSTLAVLAVDEQGQVASDRAASVLAPGLPLRSGRGIENISQQPRPTSVQNRLLVAGQLTTPQLPNSRPWKMYCDAPGDSTNAPMVDQANALSLPSQNKEWAAMPHSVPKENTLKPGAWGKEKLHERPTIVSSNSIRTASTQPSTPFYVHVDEEQPLSSEAGGSRLTSTSHAAQHSAETMVVYDHRQALSSHKAQVSKDDPIERLNNIHAEYVNGSNSGGTLDKESRTAEMIMYDRSKLYMGVTECCFEELRAFKWKKRQRQRMERERELEEQRRKLEAHLAVTLKASQEEQERQRRAHEEELERKQRHIAEREQALTRKQQEVDAILEQRRLELLEIQRLKLQLAKPDVACGAISSAAQASQVDTPLTHQGTSVAAAHGTASHKEISAAPTSASCCAAEGLASTVARLALGPVDDPKPGLQQDIRPTTERKPFAPLSLASAASSKDQALPLSPGESETKYVLGWYNGSFDTTARAFSSDVVNATSGSFMVPQSDNLVHGPNAQHFKQPGGSLQIYQDEPKQAGGCGRLQIYQDEPKPAGGSGRLQIYQDEPKPAGSSGRLQIYQGEPKPAGGSGRLQIYQDEPKPAGGSGRLQIYQDEPKPAGSSGRLQIYQDEPEQAKGSGRLRIYQDEPKPAGDSGRLQIYQDEPMPVGGSDRLQIYQDGSGQADGSGMLQIYTGEPKPAAGSGRLQVYLDGPEYATGFSELHTNQDEPKGTGSIGKLLGYQDESKQAAGSSELHRFHNEPKQGGRSSGLHVYLDEPKQACSSGKLHVYQDGPQRHAVARESQICQDWQMSVDHCGKQPLYQDEPRQDGSSSGSYQQLAACAVSPAISTPAGISLALAAPHQSAFKVVKGGSESVSGSSLSSDDKENCLSYCPSVAASAPLPVSTATAVALPASESLAGKKRPASEALVSAALEAKEPKASSAGAPAVRSVAVVTTSSQSAAVVPGSIGGMPVTYDLGFRPALDQFKKFEEPMDGIETTQADVTEQLVGMSVGQFGLTYGSNVVTAPGRQASTPCHYRSNMNDSLLANCPDDLTTIHPVLLGGGVGNEESLLVPDNNVRSSQSTGAGLPRTIVCSADGTARTAAAPPAVPAASASTAIVYGCGASAENVIVPCGFNKQATNRLSPIVERSDSSKGSSSRSSTQSLRGSSSSSQSSAYSSKASCSSFGRSALQALRGSMVHSGALTPYYSKDAAALSGDSQQRPLLPANACSRSSSALGSSAYASAMEKTGTAPMAGGLSQDTPTLSRSSRAEPAACQSGVVKATHRSTSFPDEDAGCLPHRADNVTREPPTATPLPDDAGAPRDDSTSPLERFEAGNLTAHEIDITNYCPNACHDATEALLNMSIMLVHNPFDRKVLTKLLSRLNPPPSTYDGYCKVSGSLPDAIKVNQTIALGNCSCTIIKKIGEGGFASAYVAAFKDQLDTYNPDATTQFIGLAVNNVCLKVQRQAGGGEWEFYMCSEVRRRMERQLQQGSFVTDMRSSVMNVTKAYFFDNGSILMNEYVPRGTLLDLVNMLAAKKQDVPEACVMYLTIELLSIVEQLHACRIIHGDIKPDNVLLRGLFPLSETGEIVCPSMRSLLLIDFGRSIDMSKFPHGTTFTASNDTSGFQCIEMKTGRSWTYQTDLFGLVGTVHVLLFGVYMKVYCCRDRWKINSKFKRFWQVDLWQNLFDTLLNVPDCDSMPDLAPIRRDMETRLRQSLDLRKTYANFQDAYSAIAIGENSNC